MLSLTLKIGFPKKIFGNSANISTKVNPCKVLFKKLLEVTWSKCHFLLCCNVFRSAGSDFCAIEDLEYSLADFLFIAFIQVLMKELARISICQYVVYQYMSYINMSHINMSCNGWPISLNIWGYYEIQNLVSDVHRWL